MAKIIDGKKISAEIKEELKTEVAAYAAQGKKCALAVIQGGRRSGIQRICSDNMLHAFKKLKLTILITYIIYSKLSFDYFLFYKVSIT